MYGLSYSTGLHNGLSTGNSHRTCLRDLLGTGKVAALAYSMGVYWHAYSTGGKVAALAAPLSPHLQTYIIGQ